MNRLKQYNTLNIPNLLFMFLVIHLKDYIIAIVSNRMLHL